MKQEVSIETPDNFTIYGTLDSKEKSDSLLIFVHGLSGSKDEHHYFNAVPFFTERGFDTFRFNLYSRKSKARPLSISSISTHTKDLNSVIKNFKEKYSNIYLIGHSVGCLAIMKANLQNVNSIVLWDSASSIKNIEEKKGAFIPELNKYILHWGMDIIVSKEMIEEWKSIDNAKLIEKINIPCHFIFAGNYNKHETWLPIIKSSNKDFKSIIIDGATHGFIEEGIETKLFEETYNLIK